MEHLPSSWEALVQTPAPPKLKKKKKVIMGYFKTHWKSPLALTKLVYNLRPRPRGQRYLGFMVRYNHMSNLTSHEHLPRDQRPLSLTPTPHPYSCHIKSLPDPYPSQPLRGSVTSPVPCWILIFVSPTQAPTEQAQSGCSGNPARVTKLSAFIKLK